MTSLSFVLLMGAGGALCSALLIPFVRRFSLRAGCVSRPAHDRWGHRVVTRLGGVPIAVIFLATVAWGALEDPRMLGLLLGGILMGLTGLIDDFRRLHPYSKLIAQIVAGCLVAFFGIQFDLPISYLSIPLTIGWLVLVINAFNLMDNMDGLSAGIGAIAAGFCTWHALEMEQWPLALVSSSLLGGTLGFLRYNLPPAKIFMGDTGSQVIGLGLGSLALMGTWHQSTRLLGIVAIPTLLLAVPIFDTCFVTIERILHRRHPFQGGTDHLSHRLEILGLSNRQVVFALYALSAAFGALSLLLASQSPFTVTSLSLLAVGLLALVGSYLAKVRVYARGPSATAELPVTLIETTLLHKWRILEVFVDFILVCASYVLAHALRFEATITPDLEALILQSLPWIIAVKMFCFFCCGLYRGLWRYISLTDLVNVFRAVCVGGVLSALILLYLWRFEGYSRAVFIIDGLLLFIFIGAARLTEPLLNEWISHSVHTATPVLVMGAGDTGELLLQQLKLDRLRRRRVVGFLDDDKNKQGNRIHGIPILGSRQELGRVVKEFSVREVLIAMRHPPADLTQQIKSYSEENGIAWKVVSSLAPDEAPDTSGP